MPSETSDGFVVRVIVGALWGAILSQTLALPGNIEVSAVFLLGAVGLLVITGRAILYPLRLICFAILAGLLSLTSFLALGGAVSVPALGMLFLLYGVFVFGIPITETTYREILLGFQVLASLIALLALGQWVLQAAGLPFVHLYRVVPGAFIYKTYNYIQLVSYGSTFIKPNGIFMLEASLCSQLLAIAIVFEMIYFRRPVRLLLFAAGVLSTLSGTGVLILLLTAPFLIPYVERRFVIYGLVALVPVLLGAVAFGVFDYLLHRAGEFGRGGSSGNGRFVAPYALMSDVAMRGTQEFMVGLGMGNAKLIEGVTGSVVYSPLAKAVMEMGVPLALGWLAYFHVIMLRAVAPAAVIVSMLLLYNFMNGSLLMPIIVAYSYLLVGAYPAATRAEMRYLA